MDSYVKVLRSYDYNHFEFCIPIADDATVKERNEARKDAERLANEAVRQYIIAKKMAEFRLNSQYEKEQFLNEIKRIKDKPNGIRTVNDLAVLKQYNDKKWESQFEYLYDYEDDEI